MQNQNKTILNIDESPKGRTGIKEMIDKMMNTQENGESEIKQDSLQNKTTA